MKRYSGILLHPTSLPGQFGCGDVGPSAYQFIDFLSDSKQSLWQILPLAPTSYGDSPYQCLSAFAGNPLLISLEHLKNEGYISAELLNNAPDFSDDAVDYGKVIPWKTSILKEAYQSFRKGTTGEEMASYDDFCEQQRDWLDDFALFASIKEAHQLRPWSEWPSELALKDPAAIGNWRSQHLEEIEYHYFIQFQFFKQWHALRTYANQKGIRIIGDIPIFVAADSADVWGHQELFELDEKGQPTVVAGVPPDYFSETGQRWGNPLYRWGLMAQHGYTWWIRRVQSLLDSVDIIRIDHFRGFEGYWEIPGSEETAINGRWVKGPGLYFFEVLRESLGEIPIIAEDLGLITPEVVALREASGFPGMQVLQFAFVSGEHNLFRPHHYEKNTVVYTGTHDNNTTRGWFNELPEEDRNDLRAYADKDVSEENVCQVLIRLAWRSVAKMAIAPMQDILNLGEEARMNFPGRESGYWTWRYSQEALADELKSWLASLSEIYERNL